MKLSAELQEFGERRALPWNVFADPTTPGAGFVWPTSYEPQGYGFVLPRLRIVELDDGLAERIHEGDSTVYEEIAEGPDNSGLIRFLGCHAVPSIRIPDVRIKSTVFREFPVPLMGQVNEQT